MPSESYIMSIDVGTQSTRAVVLNPAGQIIANERLISEPYYSLQPGCGKMCVWSPGDWQIRWAGISRR